MTTTDEKYILILLFLSTKVSESFLLTDAMRNAGLASTTAQVAETSLYQLGSTFTAGIFANKVALDSNSPIQVPLLGHFPLVCKYVQARNSKEDCLFRGSIVVIFYTAAGIINAVSTEAAIAIGPAMVVFAQYMTANSCLIVLCSNDSFGKKIILSSLISGLGFKLIKRFPLKYCLKSAKSLFNKLSKSPKKPKIRMKNYIKVVFLAFGIENLIIT
jgi:hypothetical protein